MANVRYDLWCIIKGETVPLQVFPLGGSSIAQLKSLIWESGMNGIFRGTDARYMTLWKVGSERLAYSSRLTSHS
jgi:hypothetical protein